MIVIAILTLSRRVHIHSALLDTMQLLFQFLIVQSQKFTQKITQKKLKPLGYC